MKSRLKANGHLPSQSGGPRAVWLTGLWRYDPDQGLWNKVTLPADGRISFDLDAGRVHANPTDQTLADLPDRDGLYWVEWREDGRRAGTLVHCGPVACNDLKSGARPRVLSRRVSSSPAC